MLTKLIKIVLEVISSACFFSHATRFIGFAIFCSFGFKSLKSYFEAVKNHNSYIGSEFLERDFLAVFGDLKSLRIFLECVS